MAHVVSCRVLSRHVEGSSHCGPGLTSEMLGTGGDGEHIRQLLHRIFKQSCPHRFSALYAQPSQDPIVPAAMLERSEFKTNCDV
jgi:hypothetical protein